MFSWIFLVSYTSQGSWFEEKLGFRHVNEQTTLKENLKERLETAFIQAIHGD